ncbi:hypothetical protein CDAR_96791 [Caerostris darwini]|uniref:Uncharacterized protein n=1 Tax=Caerostris darwini TaxID=1538125 RepID=A0AAV4QW71_9ARAC|nr:hypothetical protein CDAR_96791 [Caerostris darwini]
MDFNVNRKFRPTDHPAVNHRLYSKLSVVMAQRKGTDSDFDDRKDNTKWSLRKRNTTFQLRNNSRITCVGGKGAWSKPPLIFQFTAFSLRGKIIFSGLFHRSTPFPPLPVNDVTTPWLHIKRSLHLPTPYRSRKQAKK